MNAKQEEKRWYIEKKMTRSIVRDFFKFKKAFNVKKRKKKGQTLSLFY